MPFCLVYLVCIYKIFPGCLAWIHTCDKGEALSKKKWGRGRAGSEICVIRGARLQPIHCQVSDNSCEFDALSFVVDYSFWSCFWSGLCGFVPNLQAPLQGSAAVAGAGCLLCPPLCWRELRPEPQAGLADEKRPRSSREPSMEVAVFTLHKGAGRLLSFAGAGAGLYTNKIPWGRGKRPPLGLQPQALG